MSISRDTRRFFAVRFLLRLISPCRKIAIQSALLSAASVAVSLLLTACTEQLVNHTASDTLRPTLVVLFLLLVLAAAVVSGSSVRLSGKLGAFVLRDMKRDLARSVMGADFRMLQQVSSGDALSVMNSDCEQIGDFLSGNLFSLITQLLTALAAFLYLLALHPLLGLLAFAYTPVGMLLASRINRRLNTLYPNASRQKGKVLAAFEQGLSMLAAIKSFRLERRTVARMDAEFEALYTTQRRISTWDALLQPACLSVANTPNLVFTIVGGWFALSGRLELGAFIAGFRLLEYIIPPTVMLPFMLNNLNRATASMRRVDQLLQLPRSEITIHSAVPPAKPDTGRHPAPSVSISGLSFAYESDKPVLRDISITQNGPGITAIVGRSGSGKSTLFALLSGLYRLDPGQIRLCGHELACLSEGEIAAMVAVVPQDIHLFAGTIEDNLRAGKPEAEERELIAAARAAGVYAYSMEKGAGLQTAIGDGGAALSGGEAQKLAFARALLKDAPVWLLDEPTSALDPASEAALHDMLRSLASSRAILVAAHRLTTIRAADRIVFLQDGKVAAEGTWEELRQNPAFVRTVQTMEEERGEPA